MGSRLNLHIDESGNQDLSEGLYLVTVVLHDHSADIAAPIEGYEMRLAVAGMVDVPFHGKDLLHFQAFDTISVYYDNGQGAVSVALHDALDFVLAKDVADYRDADHSARRLLQVADYVCTIERASIAYDADMQSKTQTRFFGSRRNFMQSFRKQLARKRLH